MVESASKCNVLMVFPEFTRPSFWDLEASCQVAGARHATPPLGLATVAALLPKSWNIRLIDCNIEKLRASDLRWADMVMTGGMIPQQAHALKIIELARAAGKIVVTGGPDVTSSPHVYARSHFRVLGEAESVIDDFVAAWNAGERSGYFEAPKFQADMTRSPIPRYDLVKRRRYMFLGLQFSRGCPFNCEFCDIIELYGRVPRAKTNAQVLAELETLYQLGYRGHVDFVDDNFVGNKKALRKLLPEIIAWQTERDYPFEFSTEASINLADDDQLLGMMRDANFFTVFVGIETPDPDVLVSARKKQNTRRELSQCIHKLYSYGLWVNAGLVIGFDDEKGGVADTLIDFITAAAIPTSSVSLLCAMPNTQLTKRLSREGRLHRDFQTWPDSDNCLNGLNFETSRPRRDILADFVEVMEGIYNPDAFFERVRVIGRELRRPACARVFRERLARRDLARLVRLVAVTLLREPRRFGAIFRVIRECRRENPDATSLVARIAATYLHIASYKRHAVARFRREIARLDRGEWKSPGVLAAFEETPAVDRKTAKGGPARRTEPAEKQLVVQD